MNMISECPTIDIATLTPLGQEKILYSPHSFSQAVAKGYRLPSDLDRLDPSSLPQWGDLHDTTVTLVSCQAMSALLMDADYQYALQLCTGNSSLSVAIREWIWANMHLEGQTSSSMGRQSLSVFLGNTNLEKLWNLENLGPTEDIYANYFHLQAVCTVIKSLELTNHIHWGEVSSDTLDMIVLIQQRWLLDRADLLESIEA